MAKVTEELKEEIEKTNKKAFDEITEDKTPAITQHGKGNKVVHITHKGEGNINLDISKIKKLQAEIKHLKTLLEEERRCSTALLAAKNDEIAILKGMKGVEQVSF